MRAALAFTATLALIACNRTADAQNGAEESGRTIQRGFQVGDFDAVSLGGPYDVVVKVGGPASVRAEGDSRLIEKMEVKVEDGSLRIRPKRGTHMNFGHYGPVTVYVTAPRLTAASIGGSGDMKIDRVEADNFAASIGGSGDMEIGSLRAGQADFSVAGSGGIKASGTAARAKISIAGSGDIDTGALRAGSAFVSVMGSGDVSLHANQSADVTVMGSGDVTISGPARCSTRKMGSGDIRCNA